MNEHGEEKRRQVINLIKNKNDNVKLECFSGFVEEFLEEGALDGIASLQSHSLVVCVLVLCMVRL